MTRTVKTGKVSGGAEYAYVADRLKQFREDCPNGLIETTPMIKDDGTLMFTARVLKDKSKPESAEATGHALGKNSGAKAFEKLETQAVGRALALLGYLASGEIASAEEMEDYYNYREEKTNEIIETIKSIKTVDQLKEYFTSLDTFIDEAEIVEAKNNRYKELIKEKLDADNKA